VRLLRGDFDERSDYGDPLRLAQEFLDGGANWLHVVDLDGAKSGSADNRPIVLAMAPSVRPSRRRGIRTTTDVEELLDAGVHRVVLGTAALEDPAWAGAMGGASGAGGDRPRLPARHRRPAGARHQGLAGRLGPLGRGVVRRARRRAFGAVVVTAIDRDGTLGGPDSRDSPSCSTSRRGP